jgi:SAM-dependent methyltransferase
MIDSNTKSYEELNQEQEFHETDTFTIDRYKQFFRHLPIHTKTVLDVGCNTGRGGKVLKELNSKLQLFGLDCLTSSLEKIPSGIYKQKICSYSTDIKMESSSVDGIVAGEFIEHLYDEDIERTLQEFYRLLKPKGKLLLTTPNPNYILLKLSGGSVIGGAHVSEHYSFELKQKLKQIGFFRVQVFGSGKVSRLLGENFPILALYGSYLITAEKA